MAGNHPGTLRDAPGRIVNLSKIPAFLWKKSTVSLKKINP
jgi:hypothetical protein